MTKAKKKNLGGRPEHKPTAKDRRSVKTMAGHGVQHEAIAASLGIAKNTLYKHYREDIDKGDADAQAKIAQSLFSRGVKDKDTAALIWLSKTRLGYKDTSRVEVSGPNGQPLQPSQTNTFVASPQDAARAYAELIQG